MSRTKVAAMAAGLTVSLAAGGVAVGADARMTKGNPDSGTTWVATTPETLGATQYVAGFDSDRRLGHAAITYVITAVPSSAQDTVSLVAHDVDLYTGTGKLHGSATATLVPTGGGHATVTDGKLTLDRGSGSLTNHKLTASFSGAGTLSGGYTFTYHGTYR
jgi:hypothetical protein